MLATFSHVRVYANDVQRAAAWYQKHFGFKLNFNGGPHYASLRQEELEFRLDLHIDRDGTNVGHGAIVHFNVENVDIAYAALKADGIKVHEPQSEGGVRFMAFEDCEGNVIGLCEKGK